MEIQNSTNYLQDKRKSILFIVILFSLSFISYYISYSLFGDYEQLGNYLQIKNPPEKIEKDVFEQDILSNLEEVNSKIIMTFYSLNEEKDIYELHDNLSIEEQRELFAVFQSANITPEYLNIPKHISKKVFEDNIISSIENEQIKNDLKAYYIYDEGSENYVLEEKLNDEDKTRIVSILYMSGYIKKKFDLMSILSFILPYIFMVLPAIVAIILRGFITKEKFKQSGFRLGQGVYYFYGFSVIVSVVIFGVILNELTGLGKYQGMADLFANIPGNSEVSNISPESALGIFLFTGLIINPIISLPFYFGIEYGWRSYLQDKMINLYGKVKGLLFLGFLFGIWQVPLIILGYNYPDGRELGVVLLILFSMSFSVFLGYFYILNRSVWMVALFHGLFTHATATGYYLCPTKDMTNDFSLGVYGILIWVIIAIVIIKVYFPKIEEEKKEIIE